MLGAAARSDITNTQITDRVSLGTLDTGGFGLAVAFGVDMPHLDHDRARALVEKAHQICPY